MSRPDETAEQPSLTTEQMKRLLEVNRVVVSELELEAVLESVLEAARELTSARYAALGILDREKRSLERFLHLGIDDETRRGIGPLPRGRGVLGELIENPVPLRLDRVGAHPHSYGFPPGHPAMKSFLGVPIAVRGVAFGNIYLTDKKGDRQFDENDQEMLVTLADLAAIAIDNARAYEQSEQRRFELERAVQALQATVALSRVSAVETEENVVEELVVKRARALVGAHDAILLRTDGAGLIGVAMRVRAEKEDLPEGRISAGNDLMALARDTTAPVRVELNEARFHGELGIETAGALLAHLVHRGRDQGYLMVVPNPGSAPWSRDDELVIEAFASSAAASLAAVQDVARDRARMSLEASEAERRRWAMELHDETLQDLGALKVMHESSLASGDPEAMERSLESASRQLETTIEGLETLIHELRPSSLDALGIEAAVESLVQRIGGRAGFDTELTSALRYESGAVDDRLDESTESTIYRLIQESLHNCEKHAGATKVEIQLTEDEHEVTVVVEDDGTGFSTADAPTDRFGLLGMRERAELAGGSLEISSEPGRGTRVQARIPARRSAPRT